MIDILYHCARQSCRQQKNGVRAQKGEEKRQNLMKLAEVATYRKRKILRQLLVLYHLLFYQLNPNYCIHYPTFSSIASRNCKNSHGSLEHNLFKNVFKWVIFLWKSQIQTIKYGLNDTKRMKKKQVTLILYSFRPSDMNFQTCLLPKVILAKKITKIYSLRPFLS